MVDPESIELYTPPTTNVPQTSRHYAIFGNCVYYHFNFLYNRTLERSI